MYRTIITEAICFLFILLFVYAAVTKLLDYEKFVAQVGQSPLLTRYAGFIGWFIPSIELLIALALLLPQIRLLGLYLAFSLMVMFTSYIVVILNFNEHIPCSCGGVLEKMGWKEHLYFNFLCILLALLGIVIQSNVILVDKKSLVNKKDIPLQQESGES